MPTFGELKNDLPNIPRICTRKRKTRENMYTVPFKSTRRARTVRFLATTVSSSLFLPPFLPFLLVSPLKPLGIVLIELLLHGVGSLSSLFPRKVLIRERSVASIAAIKDIRTLANEIERERERSPSCRSEVTLTIATKMKKPVPEIYTKLGSYFDQGPLNQCLFPYLSDERCNIII